MIWSGWMMASGLRVAMLKNISSMAVLARGATSTLIHRQNPEKSMDRIITGRLSRAVLIPAIRRETSSLSAESLP